MFRGINNLTLDAKGRLAMPARYRERMQEACRGQLVVTIDRDHCLLIYPLPTGKPWKSGWCACRASSTSPRIAAATARSRHRSGAGRPRPRAAAAGTARASPRWSATWCCSARTQIRALATSRLGMRAARRASRANKAQAAVCRTNSPGWCFERRVPGTPPAGVVAGSGGTGSRYSPTVYTWTAPSGAADTVATS